MRIIYKGRAVTFMRRMWEMDEEEYDSLRGLIILLSTDPSIDNETKTLRDFGDGIETPVYADDEWWIVYRTDNQDGKATLTIVSIWDATRLPHTRL